MTALVSVFLIFLLMAVAYGIEIGQQGMVRILCTEDGLAQIIAANQIDGDAVETAIADLANSELCWWHLAGFPVEVVRLLSEFQDFTGRTILALEVKMLVPGMFDHPVYSWILAD
jgi:hypothetical protein